MRKSLIAASLLAIGMASSAFAQSNPDTIGPTNGGSTDPGSGNYSSDYTSDSNGIHPVPSSAVDPATTQSIGGQAINCPGMAQQNTGVDTRGGESGASISEACREYDN
ncbi:hypothetical protein LVY75_17620 [Sinorhizobium sp. B11]